jgi:hypothetical protein
MIRIQDPGSGIRCFFTPVSGIRKNLFRIFSISKIKKNYLQFCEICGYKKGMTTNFFSFLSFFAVFGSGIWDPKSGIQNPGWVKIRIRDLGSGINKPDP